MSKIMSVKHEEADGHIHTCELAWQLVDVWTLAVGPSD